MLETIEVDFFLCILPLCFHLSKIIAPYRGTPSIHILLPYWTIHVQIISTLLQSMAKLITGDNCLISFSGYQVLQCEVPAVAVVNTTSFSDELTLGFLVVFPYCQAHNIITYFLAVFFVVITLMQRIIGSGLSVFTVVIFVFLFSWLFKTRMSLVPTFGTVNLPRSCNTPYYYVSLTWCLKWYLQLSIY